MSRARAMIQVPEKLKEDIEQLKGEHRYRHNLKTNYDAIQWLLDYYEANEKQKKIDYAKAEEEKEQRRIQEQEGKARLEEEYIHIGTECKCRFAEFKERMGLRRDDAVVDLLQDHWESSLEINQAVMMTYITDYSKRS